MVYYNNIPFGLKERTIMHVKKWTRLLTLALVCLLLLGVSAPALAAEYTPFTPAKTGKSVDRTILMRVNPSSSTAEENVAKTLKRVKGKAFELLGENGNWYYARYEGSEGFVRKADFILIDPASATPTPAPTPEPTPMSNANAPSGDKWGKIKVDGTKINHTIYCNAVSGNDYKYNKSYYNIFSMTNYSSQVTVLMGHNMRKSAGSSKGMFHQLHHVQNAFLGRSACESCGKSCSGAKTSVFDIDYQGYKKWQLLCFYETPSEGAYSVLANTVGGTGSPASWISTQYANAQTSGYKGKVVDSSGTGSDRLMVLITCGDKYGATSTARLYMVLKAIS